MQRKRMNQKDYKKYSDGLVKRIRYDNGLPFSSGLDHNLNRQAGRIELNKATLIVFDGGVGEGKSTMMVHCGDYLQQKLLKDSKSILDLKKQYAMGGVQFQEKLQMCIDSKLPVVIYDEGGDFNKRGSLTAFNQRLNRVFETYRGYRIVVLLGLPNVKVLDEQLFDNRIPRLLINCYGRNKKSGNFRGYSLFRMYYIRHKMKKFIVPSKAYNSVEPNFRGHFLDLPPERSKELDKVCSEGKRDTLNENILQNRGLVHTAQIEKALHRSRAWVTLKIRKHKFKPEYRYKRMNYYSKEVMETLREELKVK